MGALADRGGRPRFGATDGMQSASFAVEKGCVPKIVLIAIKPLCDRGLGKWQTSCSRK
jgi:hypothetical protein